MWGRFSTREKFNYRRPWFPWKRRLSQKENFKNLKPLTGKAHHFFRKIDLVHKNNTIWYSLTVIHGYETFSFINHDTSFKISFEISWISVIFTPNLLNGH